MTAQDVLNSVLIMLDRITDTGEVNIQNTQDYAQKVIEGINLVLYDLQNIEVEQTYEKAQILDVNEEIPLNEKTINTCLKPFLCSYFAFLDNDITIYNYYSQVYNENKTKIPRKEQSVKDEYSILDGMQGV